MSAQPAGRIHPWPKYASLAATSFQQAIAYKFTTLINTALTFIWVFIIYYMWNAAYAGRSTIASFSWDEMRTYVVLAYGINAFIGWRIGSSMMQTIRTGEILRDLVRPMNYCLSQLAKAAGFAVLEGFATLIVSLLIGLFVLHIDPPASPGMALLFLLSVVVGIATKALIVFSVSLLTFWTLNGVGVMWSQQAVIGILSGTLVPIALLPDWLRVLANVLPMRGIVSTPVLIYLGKIGGLELIGLIALQLAWLAGMWVFANWAWQRAFNVVEIQGG